MEQLKKLELTEKDFQLLIDGLDALPEKGAAGSMMVDLLGSMMIKDDDAARAKFEASRKIEQDKKERERSLLTEEIKILQGKLLIVKRLLQENNVLKQAHSIINP